MPALKELIKRSLGSKALTSTRARRREMELEALLAGLRGHGWTLESMMMSDAEARAHFANEMDVDLFSRVAIRVFHEFKLDFLVRSLGRDYIAAHSVIEVGDSDGLVLKALGKTGFSINNDPRCVDLIHSNGIEARVGAGEGLDAPDKSYDIAMSFETLEHSLDPLAFLQEMARVAREKIVISVPGVTRSYMHPRVKGMRVGEEHVFEFCSSDLLNLTTHLPLRPAGFCKCPMFAAPSRPLAALHYLLARSPDLYGGCFRWFDFYIFDVVDSDQGRTREENAAVYQGRR